MITDLDVFGLNGDERKLNLTLKKNGKNAKKCGNIGEIGFQVAAVNKLGVWVKVRSGSGKRFGLAFPVTPGKSFRAGGGLYGMAIGKGPNDILIIELESSPLNYPDSCDHCDAPYACDFCRK